MKGQSVLERAAFDSVYFGYAFLDWHAHPAQAEWLRNATKPINLCRAGNRWGKTEAVAIEHLWRCSFKIRDERWDFSLPYQTVNTSISLDQASLPLLKAWRLVNREDAQPYRDLFINRFVRTPFPRIEFRNGSVWWARSTARHGEYLEGYDFDYASYDECAFDPFFDHILDEVLSIRLLDRGGQIDCISTGRRGSGFNRRFDRGEEGFYYCQQGRTQDNPTIDSEALKRLMSRLDSGLIEERLMGGVRPSEGLIPNASIMRAIACASGLDGAYEGRRYSTGWDLGKTRNYTVGVTLDITEWPYQVVAWEAFNRSTLPGIGTELDYWQYVWGRIHQRYDIYGGLTQIDVTGVGSAIGDYLSEIAAEALSFTGQRVADLISCLELAFGLGIIGLPFLEIEREDGSRWNVVDELEEVSNQLSGLDTATALALALWGVRSELQGKIAVPISPRIVGYREKGAVKGKRGR